MLITIDICGENLYIAEGNATLGGVEAHKCDEVKLPEGTVEDGDIKNHSALVMTISKLLNAHSYKSTSAVATFTSNMSILRRLTLPPGKPSELTGMVRNQMSQAVSDPADYVFEYVYASPTQSKSSPTEVWAYALEKEIVDKYYSLFKNLRLRPIALDIHSNCIQKVVSGALINGSDLTGRSVLFVDIESSFIEIHLFSGSERAFSRIAPVGAEEFLMIAGNRGYGRKDPDLSVMEKRLLALSEDHGRKKQAKSVTYDLLDITPEALSLDPILADATHQYIGHISDELLKMIQFQMMRNSSMPVSSVYVYGGFSGIKGLDTSIAQSISCPVETIESVSKVKIDQSIKLSKYLNAVGALIRLK